MEEVSAGHDAWSDSNGGSFANGAGSEVDTEIPGLCVLFLFFSFCCCLFDLVGCVVGQSLR